MELNTSHLTLSARAVKRLIRGKNHTPHTHTYTPLCTVGLCVREKLMEAETSLSSQQQHCENTKVEKENWGKLAIECILMFYKENQLLQPQFTRI